jgi:hypothetical protein
MGKVRCIQCFGGETGWKETTWKTREHKGGSYKDGSSGSRVAGKEWIDLVQDWERWRVLVNKIMNSRLLENEGNFLTR